MELERIIDLLKQGGCNVPLVIIPSFVEDAYVDKKPNDSDRAIYLSWRYITETSDEELLSTIAHEIGHTVSNRGLGIMNLIDASTTIGFMLFFLLFQFIVTILGIPDDLLLFFLLLWSLLTTINILAILEICRKEEYLADKKAVELGYGDFLMVLSDSVKPKSRLMELFSTHPCQVKRRMKIEKLIEQNSKDDLDKEQEDIENVC